MNADTTHTNTKPNTEGETMNTEQMTATIDLDEVCQVITKAGLPAYVEQTGGGCQTIYVGPWYRDDYGSQLPAWMIGPGWREGGIAYGWREEVSFGDGFGGVMDDVIVYPGETETAAEFATRCVAAIRQYGEALTEGAADCGWTIYNGIG
jgi:hypothetical protein